MQTLIKSETENLAKSKGFFNGIVPQCVLTKWLREKQGIDIEISPNRVIRTDKANGYTATIYSPNEEKFSWDLGGIHKNYEDAVEVSLFEALKLIR